MINIQIKKFMQAVTVVFALVLLSMPSTIVVADSGNRDKGTDLHDNDDGDNDGDNKKIRRVIRGLVATGFNDVLGKPAFDLGEPFGALGFSSFGIYNEFGTEPFLLDENATDSDLLATKVFPNFLALAGKTRDDVDPAWENVLLRDVPVNIDFAFVNRQPLRGVLEAGPLERAQAEPANDITLGQWLQGSGTAKIVCNGNDRATIQIRVSNLLPNRMYGIWATIGGDFLSSFPIGGTPNMFVTDQHGDGAIKRTVKFCPLNPESADRPLLIINVVFYSNHQNYGAVTEPSEVNGFWFGLVTHNHIQFPVNVKPANQ